ncbi:MAG: 3-oxoacyl-[acyl-carrier-protein] synthase [Acidobacteriota bacterium]|jgi:3-oxoacyl-[acyl-carrier-protein] synthase II|nr:3-oxoacyl-[acyl-carrier-protein] synthase [Acidobacteriota bacterium]
MERRVVVTGAGVLSPLGDSGADLHLSLLAGRSGITPVTLFPTDGLPSMSAGQLPAFDATGYLGEGNLRPLDRISRIVTSAAQRALDAAGFSRQLRAEREVGLVLGTMFSGIRTIAEFDRRGLTRGPSYVSPLDFANTVINAAAGQTAIWHDLRGVNTTVAGSAASGLQAIANAADLIRSGRADALLAGGTDELCFETLLGFARAGYLCPGDDRPLPFDARRRGFALAEGAALVMLEEAESAAARGARVLAEVRGHGAAFDSSRGADPARSARAVGRAVTAALADAGVRPEEVDALSAAANGSPRGDAAEAAGIAAALPGRAATLPVSAIRGLLGEALGAAGAFQVIDLLETLTDGRLPGAAGFERGDEGFPLAVRAGSSEVTVRVALVNAMGLDGQHAALILARPEAG